MFDATFHWLRVGLVVIFGTVKDDSLSIKVVLKAK